MAALGYAYNPADHDPDTRPDPFAAGRVKFIVLNTDVKTARSGGTYLWLELECQSGPGAGRKWWDQITLTNTNPQAVEIGQRQLSALCHAVGWLKPLEESESLHGLSGEAEVGIEAAGTDPKTGKSFSAKNVTKKYIVPEGNGAKPAAAPVAAASAPPAAAAKKKPWEK